MSPSERASGSSGTAYSVKSAWRHPACVFARSGPPRGPPRPRSRGARQGLVHETARPERLEVQLLQPRELRARRHLAVRAPPERGRGRTTLPARRERLGPGPKRTVALSPSAKSSFHDGVDVEDRALMIEHRLRTKPPGTVPAMYSRRSHATKASHRESARRRRTPRARTPPRPRLSSTAKERRGERRGGGDGQRDRIGRRTGDAACGGRERHWGGGEGGAGTETRGAPPWRGRGPP